MLDLPVPDHPVTLADWLAHAERLHPQAIDMGLERVQAVARRMALAMPCPVITVAGTNGKGSTCAMLESIYGQAGYRTGLYTSPHLVHFEERCRIGGEPVQAPLVLHYLGQPPASQPERKQAAIEACADHIAALLADPSHTIGREHGDTVVHERLRPGDLAVLLPTNRDIVALRRRLQADDLRREGLIGPELHQALTQGIEARISRERKRPKLDLALRRAELARQVPLFSQVDEATLKRLSKGFVTRYANAGEVIRRRKDSPHSVYFIASGAVEVTTAKQTNRLGRGDMFGQISLLAGRAYQGEVKAIAPTTLLVLDEARFMNILRAKKQVREKVLKMAQERGLNEAGLKKLIEALETKPVGKPSPAQQEAAAKPALPPSATAAATGAATGTTTGGSVNLSFVTVADATSAELL